MRGDYKMKIDHSFVKLIDKFPLPCAIADKETLVGCNDLFVEILNYLSKDDLVGKSIYDISSDVQEENVPTSVRFPQAMAELKERYMQGFRWHFLKYENEPLSTDIITYQLADLVLFVVGGQTIHSKIMKELTQKKKSISVRINQKSSEIQQQVLEQDTFYKRMFEQHSSVMLLIDQKTNKIINANRSALEFYGYSLSEMKNLHLSDIATRSKNSFIIDNETSFSKRRLYYSSKHITKDNGMRDVEMYSFPVKVRDKRVLFSIIHDVTEKRTNEDNLKMFKEVLTRNNEGVIITDLDGTVEWVNNSFMNITGYTSGEVIGTNLGFVRTDASSDELKQDIRDTLENNQTWTGELWNKRKSGEMYPEWITIYPLLKNGKPHKYTAIFKDISELKKRETHIRLLSQLDSLTGLYNRNFFKSKINKILLSAKKNNHQRHFYIMFIDLDNFKTINDSLGHVYGDSVLRSFTETLEELTNTDMLLARFGGDEFVLYLDDRYDIPAVTHFSQSILKALNDGISVNQKTITLSASIGISHYPENGNDLNTLLKTADIAMYTAKDSKTNKIAFYEKGMSEGIEEIFRISNRISKAIINEEFYMVFQPIYDIFSEKVVRYEALARWEAESGESIPPMKFIESAEKTGQIYKLGNHIINLSFKQIAEWKDYVGDMKFQINISVNQIMNAEFVNDIKTLIEHYEIDPKNIIFELTEGIYFENQNYVNASISKLQELGIEFSLDDFGTGYSSLSRIKKIKFSQLKIDKSFILNDEDPETEKLNHELIRTIYSIANNLDLELVAEGIETIEQLNLLKNVGHCLGQGYYFSKPLSANKATAQIKKACEHNSRKKQMQ